MTIIVATNMWKGEREQGKVWLNKEKQAFNFFQLKDKFLQFALKFHIIIQPSQFLVQRTLCFLQLHSDSLRKRFTTESNELSSS